MSHRKPLIAGNWKLHKTIAEAKELAGAIGARVGSGLPCEVVLAENLAGPCRTTTAPCPNSISTVPESIFTQSRLLSRSPF